MAKREDQSARYWPTPKGRAEVERARLARIAAAARAGPARYDEPTPGQQLALALNAQRMPPVTT